jgi:F-type H+-transporting ATPase subunit b
LKEAREMKEKIISDARKAATEEGDRMVNAARNEIEKEKNAAMAELKNQVASLSIDIAEKLIRREFENKDQQQMLINEQLKTAQMN